MFRKHRYSAKIMLEIAKVKPIISSSWDRKQHISCRQFSDLQGFIVVLLNVHVDVLQRPTGFGSELSALVRIFCTVDTL